MAANEIAAFLNHLAKDRQVSASTQSIALNAIVFLYDSVLEMPVGRLTGLKRVQRRKRLPVVLSVEEVRSILNIMDNPTCKLMAQLIYGARLRVSASPG